MDPRLREGVDARIDRLEAELRLVRVNVQTELDHAVKQDEMILGRMESIENPVFRLESKMDEITKTVSSIAVPKIADFIQLEALADTVAQITTQLGTLASQVTDIRRRLEKLESTGFQRSAPDPIEDPPFTRAAPAADRSRYQVPDATIGVDPLTLLPSAQATTTTGQMDRVTDLVTEADSPAPLPDTGAEQFVPPRLGRYAPGLAPLTTMVDAFRHLVDYRSYRLQNTSPTMSDREYKHLHTLKRTIDARFPSIGTFSGSDGMLLFAFLSELVEAFNDQSISEGTAVHTLAAYLSDQARSTYDSHVRPGRSTQASRLRATWPYVVHALLERFVTDELLRNEHRVISDAKQNTDETVNDYALRLEDAADRCRHVFPPSELVNNFVLGLDPATRSLLQTHLSHMPSTKAQDFQAIKRLAERCGLTAKAMTNHAQRSVSSRPNTPPPTGSAPRNRRAAPSTFHIPMATGPANPSPPTSPPSTIDPWPPESMGATQVVANAAPSPLELRDHIPALADDQLCDVATRLENVFMVATTSGPEAETESARATRRMLEKLEFKDNSIGREHVAVPTLTEQQVELAMSAIPSDYWTLNCWTCRESGHSAFTCPSLTVQQRIFFAYCYYRYQIAANPRVADWFKQRSAHRAGSASDPGPKPSTNTYGTAMRGRGGGGFRRGNARNRDGANRPTFVIPEPTKFPPEEPAEESDDQGNDQGQ